MAGQRIKLIVTGDMEKASLHDSLRKFFPEQNVNGENVTWETPRKLQCATSHRLRMTSEPSTQMKQLARAMLDEAILGKNGTAADLVIVIDDLELCNHGQEAIVAEHFRKAVNHELEKFGSKYSAATCERHIQLIRNRCSFHLLRPMVEAYLFADANALKAAGVSEGRTPSLRHPTDVEDFESTDPAWLPRCLRENTVRQPNAPWWYHERHPKHYLEHLVELSGGTYDETDQGKRALHSLRWCSVAKTPTDAPILSSLFEDVFNWFGVPNRVCVGTPDARFYPKKNVRRDQLLLRNM